MGETHYTRRGCHARLPRMKIFCGLTRAKRQRERALVHFFAGSRVFLQTGCEKSGLWRLRHLRSLAWPVGTVCRIPKSGDDGRTSNVFCCPFFDGGAHVSMTMPNSSIEDEVAMATPTAVALKATRVCRQKCGFLL